MKDISFNFGERATVNHTRNATSKVVQLIWYAIISAFAVAHFGWGVLLPLYLMLVEFEVN